MLSDPKSSKSVIGLALNYTQVDLNWKYSLFMRIYIFSWLYAARLIQVFELVLEFWNLCNSPEHSADSDVHTLRVAGGRHRCPFG